MENSWSKIEMILINSIFKVVYKVLGLLYGLVLVFKPKWFWLWISILTALALGTLFFHYSRIRNYSFSPKSWLSNSFDFGKNYFLSKRNSEEGYIQFTENKFDFQENQTCCVCLEVIEKNSEIGILKCNHIYHKPCLKSWLEIKKNCPLCKADYSLVIK